MIVTMGKRLLKVFAAGALVASLAMADGDDPPGRAARLSYISGTVTFQPGSVEDWVPATLNRPMTTGDRLWTEAGGRAEMTIGSAAVRMNGRTNFAFLNLDDRTTQVQVSVGALSVRLRRLNDDETFEIDTPQLALTLLRPGEYRIDVNEEGDATVVGVRGGSAEATAGSQAYTIKPLEQLRVSGTDQVAFDQRPIPPADAFDNFCEGRDRREDTSQSAKYVSRDVPGYSDLDSAGVWRDGSRLRLGVGAGRRSGGLGAVSLRPLGLDLSVGMDLGSRCSLGLCALPLRTVGYLPVEVGPGCRVRSWRGRCTRLRWWRRVGGAGFGVGIAVGGGPAVGWFPLGLREVFVPGYAYSPAYIERVNVTNTVIVNRTVFTNVNVANVTYVNRGVPGAVTVVPQNQMMAGRPVAAAAFRVPPEALARAQVQTTAAVAPERGAVMGGRAAVTAAPPAAVMNRPVAARLAPPPAPVPFAQQQQALRQNPGQPLPPSRLAQLQPPPAGGAGARPAIRQVTPPAGASAPNRPVQTATPQPQPGAPQFSRAPQNTPAPTPQAQPQLNRAPQSSPAPTPQAQPAARPSTPAPSTQSKGKAKQTKRSTTEEKK